MAESSLKDDTEEPMEIGDDQVKVPTDTAMVQVDITWPDEDVPEKWSFKLQRALQTMFNKDLPSKCEVHSVRVLDKPHSVMVKISPASVLSMLLDIKSRNLTLKEENKTINVSFSQPGSPLNSGDQKKLPVLPSAPEYPRDSNTQDQGAIKKKPKEHQAANGEMLKKHQDSNMAESGFNGATQTKMEVDDDQGKVPTDTAMVHVDINWPHEDFPEKWSFILIGALQTMFNNDLQIPCEVHSVHVLDKPHSVMVKISPASVLSRLLDVQFTKLTLKEPNEMVRVSFSQPGNPLNSGDQKKNPVPAGGLVYPGGSNPQDRGAVIKKSKHHQAANGPPSSAGLIGNTQNAGRAHWQSEDDSDEEPHNAKSSNRHIQENLLECRIPVCHYSHLSSAYRTEMDNIEKKFGVKFKDSVLVSIEANDRKTKAQANQAFTELVQSCCLNFEIVTLPKANLEPGILTEMLKEIQKDEEAKLELSVSAQGYRLSGPRERIEEIMKRIGVMSSRPKTWRLRENTDEREELQMQQLRDLTTKAAGASRNPQAADDEEDKCPICLDKITNKKKLRCTHMFCSSCLDDAVKSLGPQCPVCKEIFGQVVGDQPHGTMNHYVISAELPGFSKCGTIVICYLIPSGVQTERHPNPGKRFRGTTREAFLPNNREGKEVLELLKRAFRQKLIFTVGVSRTTGESDTVIWNDIHHKTSQWGGPTSFGYPDHGYFARVKEELKAKGIK